jgi:hypothetical protein
MEKIVELGGEPVLGLMQVPAPWAAVFHKQPQELFDPCTNIAIATAKLSELEYDCSRPAKSNRRNSAAHFKVADAIHIRPCVAHKYAQAIGVPEFELVVLLELRHQSSSGRAGPAEMSATSILGIDRAPAHSGDQLFFEVVTPAPPSPLVNPFANVAKETASQ